MNKFLLSMFAVALAGSAFAAETDVIGNSRVFYDNTLTSSDCGFTFTKDSDVQPWLINSSYGLKASAYIGGVAKESDGLAISPVFDLTAVDGSVTCTFEHAVNQFKDNNVLIDMDEVGNYCEVLMREEDGEWENVKVEFPSSFSWTYIPASIDMSSYAGKKAQIAFRYTSTTYVAGTWEIKNMKVTGIVNNVALNFGDINTDTDIVGEYVETAYNEDGSIKVRAHWQPLDKVVLNGYTFTFSVGEGTKGAPALFTTNKEDVLQIRLYPQNTMTITAPEGETFGKMTFMSNNAADDFNFTASVGNCKYASDVAEWATETPVNSVTFTAPGIIRLLSVLISSEGGVIEPEPEPGVSTDIYNNSLMTDGCGFTFTTDGNVQPWVIDSKYGLKASAYIGGAANESEGLAISPIFDLTEVDAAVCAFEHAVNQFKEGSNMIDISLVGEYCEVLTRQEGGEWEKENVSFPSSFSWTYVPTSVDLTKYAGQKAQVAFRYISTSNLAGTWEIKNMKVTGGKAVKVNGVETETGEVRFFDLQGRQVVNPEKGLYIRVQGSKATKVML